MALDVAYWPVSSDIAPRANVGVQGNSGRDKESPNPTFLNHHVSLLPSIDALQKVHSITSSARARIDCGTVRPSALAVLRLIISSYLVGTCTGSSAGFAPLRMRST